MSAGARQLQPPRPRGVALLEAALGYVRLRWLVLPIYHPVREGCFCFGRCSAIGKHPRTLHGLLDATTDESKIREWWDRVPCGNIGIRTGASSGVVVVDVDPRNGGEPSLAELVARYGALPDTVEVRTGGGGQHFYFGAPKEEVRSRVNLAPGIDLKAEGGYVVAPPSQHASGALYEWVPGKGPGEIALAPLPAWLLDVVGQRPRFAETYRLGAPIPEGERNRTLFGLAKKVLDFGIGESGMRALLHAENSERCAPSLDDAEVDQIATSAARSMRRLSAEFVAFIRAAFGDSAR